MFIFHAFDRVAHPFSLFWSSIPSKICEYMMILVVDMYSSPSLGFEAFIMGGE